MTNHSITNRLKLKNSVETLRIVYMVVAGLALTRGLENLVFQDSDKFQLPIDIILWAFFIIFVTTVVRFVHGAMRHFDYYYVENPQDINWRGQPLWDFLFLGIEAFFFFILAFSLDNQTRFITYYIGLLIIDTLWIFGVFITHLTRVFHGRPLRWLIANAIVLVSTGIPWIWYNNDKTLSLGWLVVFIVGVLVHTIMDYWCNWRFYFPNQCDYEDKAQTN